MKSVNTFATLLEVFFNFFLRTHTHTQTDTKALLYPCCACARGVTNSNTDTLSVSTVTYAEVLHITQLFPFLHAATR